MSIRDRDFSLVRNFSSCASFVSWKRAEAPKAGNSAFLSMNNPKMVGLGRAKEVFTGFWVGMEGKQSGKKCAADEIRPAQCVYRGGVGKGPALLHQE